MSLDSDVIVDRRRIRRKLTFCGVEGVLGCVRHEHNLANGFRSVNTLDATGRRNVLTGWE